MSITAAKLAKKRLTLRRTVDHLVLLLGVLQNALRTEHLFVGVAVELDLLLGVGLAVLDAAYFDGRRRLRLLVGLHGKASQHLVVHWQVVWRNLVRRLIVRALQHAVLWELTAAFEAEGVAAR